MNPIFTIQASSQVLHCLWVQVHVLDPDLLNDSKQQYVTGDQGKQGNSGLKWSSVHQQCINFLTDQRPSALACAVHAKSSIADAIASKWLEVRL
jgi:hypothetical protein